jgi:EmrB/QacA subfamily drug resistance transporter
MLAETVLSRAEGLQKSSPSATLAVLSLGLLMVTMDNTILNVAIPTIQEEFAASASALQWMVDAYLLTFAGLLLTMGAIGDRFGRARILNLGLVVFSLASVAAAVAATPTQLIAARAIMGVGGALIMPSTLSILTQAFSGAERAKAIAIWTAVGGLGVSIGPVVGGALLEEFPWWSIFLINLPLAGVALVSGSVFVPESRDERERRLDLPGAALSASAVTALVYAIIEAPGRGWTDTAVLTGFVAAAVLAVLFLVREAKTSEPMLDLTFFSRSAFSASLLAISVAFFALVGVVYGMTQYLQFVRGFSPLEAGAALLPVGLGVGIGSKLGQRIAARRGVTLVVPAGLIVLAGSLLGASLFEIGTSYPAIGADFFFIAMAIGLVFSPATERVMSSVPLGSSGVASAMNDVARQVGGALGVAVIGSVLNSVYRSRAEDSFAGIEPLVAEPARLAENSVGSALRVASSLPEPIGEAVMAAARSAFVDALGIAVILAAGIALVGAVIVAVMLCAKEDRMTE